MPRGLGDLAASAADVAKAIPEAERRGVTRAALHTTQVIRAEIRRVTGDMRLSGVGATGAKVGARYDLKRGRASATAEVKATGPLHLIERDTSAHVIWPKGRTYSRTRRGGIRRRGTKTALTIGSNLRAYADHRGTTGQYPFRKGWQKAAQKTPLIFRQEVRKQIVRAWQ